jgi:hypothetical protein
MLYMDIMAVHCGSDKERKSKLCGQDTVFLAFDLAKHILNTQF